MFLNKPSLELLQSHIAFDDVEQENDLSVSLTIRVIITKEYSICLFDSGTLKLPSTVNSSASSHLVAVLGRQKQ